MPSLSRSELGELQECVLLSVENPIDGDFFRKSWGWINDLSDNPEADRLREQIDSVREAQEASLVIVALATLGEVGVLKEYMNDLRVNSPHPEITSGFLPYYESYEASHFWRIVGGPTRINTDLYQSNKERGARLKNLRTRLEDAEDAGWFNNDTYEAWLAKYFVTEADSPPLMEIGEACGVWLETGPSLLAGQLELPEQELDDVRNKFEEASKGRWSFVEYSGAESWEEILDLDLPNSSRIVIKHFIESMGKLEGLELKDIEEMKWLERLMIGMFRDGALSREVVEMMSHELTKQYCHIVGVLSENKPDWVIHCTDGISQFWSELEMLVPKYSTDSPLSRE